MIVLTIIGLLVLCISGNTMFFNRSITRAQLEQLYSMCHLARQTALATNKAQTILVDIATHTYSWGSRKESLPRTIRFGFIPGTQGPPSNPTTILHTPITFAGNKITFYPDGIIQAGTLYLVDEQETIMYALSNAVSQFSYLRMYRYDGTWHLL
jgi:Tfp pilus assembly protein FimT